MEVPPPLPPPFTTDKSTRLLIAPGFIGTLISWLLLGTLIVQIYLYHLHLKRDSWRMKLMVYGLFILELVHTGVVTHDTFDTLIIRWGDPNVIIHPSFTVAAIPFIDGMIGVVVQWFFMYRIWVLGNSRWSKVVCVIIALIATLQVVAAMSSSIVYWNTHRPTAQALGNIFTLVQIWLSASFAVDLLIAATMIYILQVAKNASEFRATNDLITKLIRQTVQTGAWTAIFALLEVITLQKAQEAGNTHLIPGMILGKLYTNSLMVNLNARKWNREVDPSDYDTEFVVKGGESKTATSTDFGFVKRSRAGTVVDHSAATTMVPHQEISESQEKMTFADSPFDDSSAHKV